MTDQGRVPPHDLDAEKALLGAAMLSRDALRVLVTATRPEDYHSPAHQLIAGSLTRAHAAKWDPDPVTVADDLRRDHVLDRIPGGPAYLLEVATSCPAPSGAPSYARIIHDLATLRRLITAGDNAVQIAYAGGDAHEAVQQAQGLLDSVASQNGQRSASTLEVADIADLLAGDLEPEEPAILRRTDGRHLFYAGKMHVLQAEPSVGKTWIALAAVLEVLAMGGSVLYVDFEDTARGMIGRLLALGADPADVADRFAYVQPAGPFGPIERVELFDIADQLVPDLVIIDGVAEALARSGYDENSAPDFLAWLETLARPLARQGAAVVMLDHVVKDAEKQGRWGRGTGAKLGAVDGASYTIKTMTTFSRKRSGAVKLIIAKDRPGGVGAIGETAAIVKIDPHGDGARVLVTVEPNTVELAPSDPWRPTVLMRRLSDELARTATPLNARQLFALVHSDNPRHLSEALARLMAEGHIVEGPGKDKHLRLVRPFDDGARPPIPDEPPDLDFEDYTDRMP